MAWYHSRFLLLVGAAACIRITPEEEAARWDVDRDGVPRPADCDDRDDGMGIGLPFYEDRDGDGHGDPARETVACEAPDGFVAGADDCDDLVGDRHPGAEEVCDGADDDCDGATDEELPILTGWPDEDGDGFGDPAAPATGCALLPGHVDNDLDCDDADAATRPGAVEVCDGADDDCDALVDLDDPDLVLPITWADADGDGLGDPATAEITCDAVGRVDNGDDCDDADAGVGLGDLYYTDADGDSFGDFALGAPACSQPAGTVTNGLDCDDASLAVSPLGVEVCNGVDDDCDFAADDADPLVADRATWFRDLDGDGFGSISYTALGCLPPAGFVGDDTDCDDVVAAVNPGATEVCDGIDDDCDDLVDDADPDVDLTGVAWYLDADADGFGDASVPGTPMCAQPFGYVADPTDCDDASALNNPAAAELCDALDNDCDALVDEDTPTRWYRDADGDGFGDVLDR